MYNTIHTCSGIMCTYLLILLVWSGVYANNNNNNNRNVLNHSLCE